MRKSRFNEQQIIAILKESEAGLSRENCAGGTALRVGASENRQLKHIGIEGGASKKVVGPQMRK